MAGRIRSGIAGWVFPPWRGEFYPEGLPQKRELAYASSVLGAIEINATFYGTQKPQSFGNWAGEVPEGFVFSVKGPKFITQSLKLKNARQPLANFFASGPLRLGSKLGPFVWQLPPTLAYDPALIEEFLALLPQTPEAAAEMAAAHDDRVVETHLSTDGVTGIRHALEVRHKSFAHPSLVALLRKYNVALVTADTADWPYRDVTADLAYARLQGPVGPGSEGYGEADIVAWANTARLLASGSTPPGDLIAPPPAQQSSRDVFIFFVHTDKLHAPRNARALMERVAQA